MPNEALQPTGAALAPAPGPRPLRRPRRLNWAFAICEHQMTREDAKGNRRCVVWTERSADKSKLE